MNLPYDLSVVMSGLKDFQQRTVEYVFERLYGDNSTHRFLVADEAGLGKTMVAKGVIAHTVKHLWKTTERIDIIYICSNADIARQNINRLNITDQDDFVLTSRITMLPAQLKDINQNKLNFVSFTPGTSFNLRSTLGIRSERVLLYWLLDQAWGIASWGSGPKNVLRGYAGAEGFRARVKEFDKKSIDPSIRDSFLAKLREESTKTKSQGGKDLESSFRDLCDRFQWKRMDHRIPQRDKNDRGQIIGRLRSILAQVCLQALEPDLVILDEFQRFKHLLSGDDEASMLARDMFTYSDEHTDVRVLLLSAT
ncbi:DEAD/DEAH box helicase, partial [bacterium]|nr:DEAD/DEAH box helicase [bacterium]